MRRIYEIEIEKQKVRFYKETDLEIGKPFSITIENKTYLIQSWTSSIVERKHQKITTSKLIKLKVGKYSLVRE